MDKFSSKSRFLLFAFVLLTTIVASAKEPEYSMPLDQMIYRFSGEMKTKYGFLYKGYGGELMCDVKRVTISYKLYKQYSLEEVRVLIVSAENRFIEYLNTDMALRPYLRSYPATSKNASIDLSFHDRNLAEGDMGMVDVPFVAFALCTNGKVIYYVNLREPSGWKANWPNYEEIHRETFQG